VALSAFPLRNKILLLCLACTLLALGLQTALFLSSTSGLLFGMEKQASQKSLVRMQDELYGWVKGYENALISLYGQTDVLNDLSQGSDGAKRLQGTRLAYTLMQTAFTPNQYVSALYLYSVDSQLISSARLASTPRYQFPEDIFEDAQANRTQPVLDYVASDNRVMLITSVYNASRQQTLLRFVLKLYGNNVRTKVGFLVCDVDPKGFSRIVEKYAYSDRQLVWLQPGGDDPIVVFGHEGGDRPDFQRIADAVRDGLWRDSSGERVGNKVFLSVPQQKYRLTAYSLVPQEYLEESQAALFRNLLLTAVLLVAFASVSVTLVTRSLTTPLTKIVTRLGQIQQGNTELRLESLGNDELGVLGRSINEMLDRIRDLIAEEYRTELQLKHAEYKALQAQVNPHFLHNTLETMAGVAAAEHAPMVASLCRAMSQLFRYSLEMADPLATLGDELEHLKNYLHVMNARTRNSLEVSVDVAPELLRTKIPRLSVQPLVENSIIHGLKNKRGAKKIRIAAKTDQANRVEVLVEDNGVGMDAAAANLRLETVPLAADRDASIGLGNIHARVSLLFGAGYGLRVESEAGHGTRVWVSLPRGGERVS
jgi:sensor histidine kinase YesM